MKKLIALSLAIMPVSVLAAVEGPITSVTSIFDRFTSLSNAFITILISLAVVWIIFNIIKYLVVGGEEERKKGGMAILYGVIALFVILSIWGIVAILKNSFSTGNNTAPVNQFPAVINPNTAN